MSEVSLKRVTRDEVPLARRWQIGAVWDLEVSLVKRWLDQRAADNLGKTGATSESALSDGANLSREINLTFGAQGAARDHRLISAAANGIIERDAPARGAVIATDLAKWLLFLSEISIFIWMVVMGFSTAIVIVVGVLLAGSGLLAGDGAGRILVRREREHDWADLRGWIELIIGTAGVAAISYIRTIGEEEGVFTIVAITAFLATLIATFHAMHMVLAEKYREQHQKMFSAQGWFSTDEHLRAYQGNFWQDYYESQVRALGHQIDDVNARHSKLVTVQEPVAAGAATTVPSSTADKGPEPHESAN